MVRIKEIERPSYEEALEFCGKHPYRTLAIAHWLTEQITNHREARPGWLLGEYDQNHQIVGLALISETGILFPVLHTDECFSQIEAITRVNPGMIRVLLGPEDIVDGLWNRLRRQGLQARIDQHQVMYRIGQDEYQPPKLDFELRLATSEDLDQLVQASANMAKEESGDDAQARNPAVFRERVAGRLQRQRDFIYEIGGEIVFKASVSSLTSAAGQIEGVYTVPKFRRQGFAKTGTQFMTHWVLQRSTSAILLVNHDNLAARSIYEALGFRPILNSRTIFIAS